MNIEVTVCFPVSMNLNEDMNENPTFEELERIRELIISQAESYLKTKKLRPIITDSNVIDLID